MDFSKLSQNHRLAVYGAAAVTLGAIIGFEAARIGLVAVAAAAGMLAVVFLPQMSPPTSLPGSKGSLMLLLGGVAAVILVLGVVNVLLGLGVLLRFELLATLAYLVAVAGGVLMTWAGWQEFQTEGGKFQLGSASPTSPSAPTSTQAKAPQPATQTTTAPPADPPPADPDQDRRPGS